MLSRDETIRLLQANLDTLKSTYGVRKVALFGSRARDEAAHTSDVDLLVEFERPIGLRFVELVEHLEGILDAKADVLTPDGIASMRNRRIAERILESLVYA